MTNKTVSFHDEPPSSEQSNRFKDALSKAKQGQRSKPEDLQGTPRFDQTGTWKEGPTTDSSFLSEDTKRGLENMARSAAAEAKQAANKPKESAPQEQAQQEQDLSPEDKLKAAIEGRLEEIDIGQYLMSGEIRQVVPIIPDKLEVEFKSVSDLEESYVDMVISKEPTNISNRQFLRKMNELALAIHINSVNGTKWPKTLDGDGTINEEAIEARMRHIKKLSSPVFNMMTQNLSWFIDRINNALTASALGNG